MYFFPLTKFYFMVVRTLFLYFIHMFHSTSAVLDTKKDAIYLINSQQRNNLCIRSAIENFSKCDSKLFVSMLLFILGIFILNFSDLKMLHSGRIITDSLLQ